MNFLIGFGVEDPKWDSCEFLTQSFLDNIFQHIFEHLKLEQDYEVSILFTSNHEVQKLNAQYRGKDKPTNILSFPLQDEEEDVFEQVLTHKMLGELILAYDVINEEAHLQQKTFIDHLSHLIVHGTLHLLGYDHLNDKEAEIMEMLEMNILKKMNISNPYL